MVVCVCKGINETKLISAVKNGCCSMKRIRCELGVGQQCGKCLKTASELMSKNTISVTKTCN